MRKSIIIILMAVASFSACKKDPAVVSTVVTVSYPTVTLNGADFIHIPVGGTFVDQGATLIDDITGASSQVSATESELDVTTPGLYAVKYIAANANGFRTQATRGVLVLDYTPPVGLDPAFDISGDYLRAATGVVAKLIRMDNGLYIFDHVGGSTAVPVYMLTPDTTSIDVPLQTTYNGLSVECTNEVLTTNPPPITFRYKVAASGFGTSTRTFVKQ